MAKQTSLYLPKNVNNFSFQGTGLTAFVAPNTNIFTIFTAGAVGGDDSDVKSIVVSTNETAAVNLILFITRGGTNYILTTVNIPITAGTTGAIPSIDLIGSALLPGLPADQTGKRYIPLKNGDLLKVAALANMTAGKDIFVNCFGYDY